MSEFLRQQGALTPQLQFTAGNNYDARRRQIKIIQDMINGYEAVHAKARWKTANANLSDAEWYAMYVSYEYMTKVIQELKVLAPLMKNFTTEDTKYISVLSTMSRIVDWNQLFFEIYETLETKGDFFATWSTNDESKIDGIPRLRVLETESMDDIQLNPLTNEVEAYIYKETVKDERLDEENGTLDDENSREVTWIFKKGYIRANDSVKYEKGYKIFKNKPEYSDIIRIIHIPTFKKQSDKFSKIPAIEYIDPCLLLDRVHTSRSTINDHLGFPFPFIIGGYIDRDKSQLIPGGSACIFPEEWLAEKENQMPQVVQMEINNDLQSIKDEIYDAVTDLYKKVCLMREGLEEKLGSSDSSRNISQLRLGLEQKNKKYYTNISVGFETYIKVVLQESKVLKKKDMKKFISFKVEDILVNNSLFDSLLLTAQKRALGYSTLDSELKEAGMTDAEITKRKELITEELYGKNNDMSFSPNEIKDRVSNGNNLDEIKNLDNNFK